MARNRPPGDPPPLGRFHGVHGAEDYMYEQGFVNPLAQTMGECDTPHQHCRRRTGARPAVPRVQDCEISPDVINLVKQNQYHGLPTEHPMDHVELFEELCSTIKIVEGTEDYMKCKLFPFSLTDKATKWVKDLMSFAYTTWEEFKGAFLNYFLNKSRTNLLRSKIQGFRQGESESFHEAWERFKDYERDCPHHGFSPAHMMNTFYQGIDQKHQERLNTASSGDFTTKTIEEAKTLIGNFASSEKNSRFNHQVYTDQPKEKPSEVSEIKMMLEEFLRSQIKPSYTREERRDYRSREEEVYLTEAHDRYHDQRLSRGSRSPSRNRGHENYGPRRSSARREEHPREDPSSPFANQMNSLELMMKELQAGALKNAEELNSKFNKLQEDLVTKYESIFAHVSRLDKQVQETACSLEELSSSQDKHEQNLAEAYMNAITLRSGTAYKEPPWPKEHGEEEKEKEAEKPVRVEEKRNR